MKIAIAAYRKQDKFEQGVSHDEDADLIAYLTDKGLKVTPAIWNDPGVDWNHFDVVVIKSTWDYHDHLPEFISWIDRLEQQGVKVLNPAEIIRWNSHKKYLKEIAEKGLPTIPSVFLDNNSRFDPILFDQLGADQLVVKPCVSAGAQNTVSVHRLDWPSQEDAINLLLREADYIAQPFVEEIKDGEWSFLFFNGRYSHCALKTPKQDDFRVQHHHGGTISYPEANPLHIRQAASYVAQLPQDTLYARVDGVIIDGNFVLMELELIEPYLFFNGSTEYIDNFYQALIVMTSKA